MVQLPRIGTKRVKNVCLSIIAEYATPCSEVLKDLKNICRANHCAVDFIKYLFMGRTRLLAPGQRKVVCVITLHSGHYALNVTKQNKPRAEKKRCSISREIHFGDSGDRPKTKLPTHNEKRSPKSAT